MTQLPLLLLGVLLQDLPGGPKGGSLHQLRMEMKRQRTWSGTTFYI